MLTKHMVSKIIMIQNDEKIDSINISSTHKSIISSNALVLM